METTVNNLFEIATRQKLRFTYRGTIGVEELWDLPLTALDTIYKTLNAELKTAQEDSLLNTKTKASKELEVKIELIKHIVQTRQAEAAAKRNRAAKAEELASLRNLLAEKNNEALKGLSPEELQAKIAQLETEAE